MIPGFLRDWLRNTPRQRELDAREAEWNRRSDERMARVAAVTGVVVPINAGRELAMIRVNKEREAIRATAREMRARLGLPAVAVLEARR